MSKPRLQAKAFALLSEEGLQCVSVNLRAVRHLIGFEL
jgi:hypothetical protein